MTDPAAPSRPPLSSVIPPLILGTATFNTQYVTSPTAPLTTPIVHRALSLLPSPAFDTSPYYGPSETLLGTALHTPPIPPRSSYFLVTKAGRVASSTFDYRPSSIRSSVYRSLERLGTEYLDLVYCHDVEYVSCQEVLGAVQELRKLRDEGVIRYIGISGYPIHVLADLAGTILQETGSPLDAVLSFSNFCVQNSSLGNEDVLQKFRDAKVEVLLNASILSMGLLTTRGIDASPMAAWHPSPAALREKIKQLSNIAKENGKGLEEVSIRWAMDTWAERGKEFGTTAVGEEKMGVTVMGVSSVQELEETCRVWQDVLAARKDTPGDGSAAEKESEAVRRLVEDKMWPALGEWKDFRWQNPPEGYVNELKVDE